MSRIDESTSSLRAYGYSKAVAAHFESLIRRQPSLVLEPGRVSFASRERYRVVTAAGEREAHLAGRLRRDWELPAVGDWIALAAPAAVIHEILPRRTQLSRKVAGERTREQVVAANIDTVFLVMGLDGDYNLRRLERLAVMARESGARPVVVLTKKDLVADSAGAWLDARIAVPGVEVFAVSSLTGEGLEPLAAYLEPALTVALIGSSGAGKSTLLNRLCGAEIMRTGAVRAADDRGRHVTTHRQLVQLPGGALLIDNPGLREVQLWADDEALTETFDDIESLSRGCRFRDCEHGEEPGCAVREAVEEGTLDARRLANWRGLVRELRQLERRRDVATRRADERQLGRMYRRIQAEKSGRFGNR